MLRMFLLLFLVSSPRAAELHDIDFMFVPGAPFTKGDIEFISCEPNVSSPQISPRIVACGNTAYCSTPVVCTIGIPHVGQMPGMHTVAFCDLVGGKCPKDFAKCAAEMDLSYNCTFDKAWAQMRKASFQRPQRSTQPTKKVTF